MAQRIGVDVGGTNVKIALVSDKGKIIYSNSIPTRAEMGYEYTINSMKDAIRDLLKETKLKATDVEAIGFGFPGQIDCKKGIVRLAPNIPGWVNVPIASIMEKEFGQRFVCTFRNLINEGLRIYGCVGIRKFLIEGKKY